MEKVKKFLTIIALCSFIFVGCTTGPDASNGTSNSNSSASQTTDGSGLMEFDEVLNQDGVRLGLIYQEEQDDWQYNVFATLPTPCHQLEVEPIVRESYPEQVVFNVNIQQPESGELCAQVLEDVEVDGELDVSPEARFELNVL